MLSRCFKAKKNYLLINHLPTVETNAQGIQIGT